MLLEYSVDSPLNREPPVKDLVRSFITKASVAYDRNHGPLPHINGDSHLLRVDGAVAHVLDLSLHVLRTKFEQHEVIAALQCAGNRRHTMRTEMKEVDGIDWNDGAVCNCVWRGPLLADILARAGVQIQDLGSAHVAFSCLKTECQDDTYYGSSVALSRCLDRSKKVMVALEMNGHVLDINHGYPIRIVLPGIAGARWTKWLDRITVQKHESMNFYMQKDYKILPAEVLNREQASEYWHRIPPLLEMPVNSIIAAPESGTAISHDQDLEVSGYALPQADDGPIVRVQVSVDLGITWLDATLTFPTQEDIQRSREVYRWSWTIWKVRIPKEDVKRFTRKTRIWSRALDVGNNLQCGQNLWNLRGICYNGYGEVKRLVMA